MNDKKYAKLENITAVYDERRNSVSLIGEKGQFSHGFKIRLKRGTPEDVAVREIIFKNEVDTLANFSGPMFYPENLAPRLHQIPLGKNPDNEEVNWDFGQNGPSSLLVTGKVGSGKTMLLNHIAEVLNEHYGSYSEIYFFDEKLRAAGESAKNIEKALANIGKRLNNQEDYSVPTFVLIDELPYIMNSSEEVRQRLVSMLALSRSQNLHFIFAAHSSRQVDDLRKYCQEAVMNTTPPSFDGRYGDCTPAQRYGMIVSSEETQVFAPYLPQSFKDQWESERDRH